MTSVLSAQPFPNHPPPLGGAPSENQFGFPIESDDVLLSTLAKIGCHDVKEHDIQKPTQQVALTCFAAFLELLSYVNDDVIDTLKGDCLERLEHRELYDDPIQFIIRFREIRALMIASCVPDFCISDITRPKPKRFKKQIFALINFLRFSEHHIQHFDKIKEDNDHVFKERDEMAAKLADVAERLRHEEEARASQEARTLELREINAQLSEKLRQLKEEQSILLNELEDAKQDKNTVHARLLKLIETSRLLGEEIDKMTLRIENTPKELRTMIEKQKRQLKEKKASHVEEEAKAQSMHAKKRVLDGLESDIVACAQLVKTCIEEQAKVAREQQELERVRRDAQDTTKERDNLTMRIAQLQEQMKWASERLERAQRNIVQKRDENKRRIEEGAGEWEAVQAEKRRRAQVADEAARELATLEDEYDDLTRAFDAFYADLVAQKQRLETQCHAYMTAIARQMDLQVDF